MNTFINFSNHPLEQWSAEQLEAAEVYGKVITMPFPTVSAIASPEEIQKLAETYAEQILSYSPKAAMCQGEFTLTYAVIEILRRHGVLCVAACTERKTVVTVEEDGSVCKTSSFLFCQFRPYFSL